MKKLHLGCGTRRMPGYLNVDIQQHESVDLIADLRDLPLEKESFDIIYNCAVIEHFGRHEWKDLLAYWSTFLKKGGKMYISTTDFDAIVERYKKTKNINELLGFLVGGQKSDYDWHGMVFNFEVIKNGLESIGFKDVKRYDWQTFDVGLHGVDDYSQAYLPHMDKENGHLMVLNVCGIKI